jgi:prefoldin subunit 5
MSPAQNGVKDDDELSVKLRRRVRALSGVACVAVLLVVSSAAAAPVLPKPSPSPNPMIAQLDDVVAELREVNATLGALRTSITELGGRIDRLEQLGSAIDQVKATAVPMREEVRGLYVETSNVRSEIARLEEKSAAEAESLGKSRYVFTLLLVATMVLQVVVLAALLRR